MSTFLAGSMPGGDPDHRCALPTSWPLQDPRVHKEVEHERKAGTRASDDDHDHQHWHHVQEEAGEASKEQGHWGEFATEHSRRGDLRARTKSYFRLVVFKLVSQKLICNPPQKCVWHALSSRSENSWSVVGQIGRDPFPASCALPMGQLALFYGNYLPPLPQNWVVATFYQWCCSFSSPQLCKPAQANGLISANFKFEKSTLMSVRCGFPPPCGKCWLPARRRISHRISLTDFSRR